MRTPVALGLAVGLLAIAGCSGDPQASADIPPGSPGEKEAIAERPVARAEAPRPEGGSRRPIRRIGPAPSAPEESKAPAEGAKVAREGKSTLPKADGKALSPAPRKAPKGSDAGTSPKAPAPAKKPAGKKADTAAGAAAKTGSDPGASPPSKPRSGGSPAQKPKSVKLPEAGDVPASELFLLLGKLAGLKIVLDDEALAERPIRITEGLAGQSVSREELAILLAAYGIYLFPHDRADGSVLVVTTNPRWTPPPEAAPRYTRSFQVRSRDFEAVRKEVEAYIEKRNLMLPPESPPISIAADARTARFIVRAPSEDILKGVEETIGKASEEGKKKSSSLTHLYTYTPANRRAEDLQSEVLESLDDAQKARVTVVVPRGRNILMIQTTEEMYVRIKAILEEHDARPAPNRVEGSEE